MGSKGRSSASPEPAILRRGKRFHAIVQKDWKATAEGAINVEKTIPLLGQPQTRRRSGRMDIFVDEAGDNMVAIVEVKATNWDRVRNVNRLLASHNRQIWKYIEKYYSDRVDISPGIIYPRPPKSQQLRAQIEDYLFERGIPVVWYYEPIKKH